jgi:hypothetical protein
MRAICGRHVPKLAIIGGPASRAPPTGVMIIG